MLCLVLLPNDLKQPCVTLHLNYLMNKFENLKFLDFRFNNAKFYIFVKKFSRIYYFIWLLWHHQQH